MATPPSPRTTRLTRPTVRFRLPWFAHRNRSPPISTTPARLPLASPAFRSRYGRLLRLPARRPLQRSPQRPRRTNSQRMTRPLSGKTALVTGAAKRIGRAIALALAENGANVAITYLGSQREAESTVAELAAFDVDALAVRCDLHDPQSIVETVSEVVDEFGRLDLLVNNAGVLDRKS